MIGRTIAHYKIEEKLGEGGMGVVYKAEDTRLKRPVALKFLPQQALGDRENKERFLREARAAAALDHPSICTIYEVAEWEGETFLAMAYIDGQTVHETISSGPLPVEQSVRTAVQMLEGLQEAHERGIIHRDIKSANIMLTRRQRAVILDFGLAQIPEASRVTIPGTTIGTAAYMSPEQALGEEVDRRSDIWSVGVVLYEMLTAELPFQGEYPPAVLYAVVHEKPRPMKALEGAEWEGLTKIVYKALKKKRDDRYQRVSEMIGDLRAFLGPDSSVNTSSGMIEQRPEPQEHELARTQGEQPLQGSVGRVVLVTAAVMLFGALLWLVFGSRAPTVTSSAQASVAVLPLENISEQQEEFFTDGMTEALITQLAKIRNLRVISRISVMHYKNSGKPLPQIAGELGVDYIVEGSVQRVDDRVRIAAQLLDANKDEHIWAETYDRQLEDILALQSEVARAIAREVHVELTAQDRSRLAKEEAVDFAEYQLCLRGRHYWNQRTGPSLAKAIESFQRALEIDSECAHAYAGLAQSYAFLGVFGGQRPEEVMPKAKQAALEAISIDGGLADAHVALGMIRAYYDWDWEGAQQQFERAMELNPGSAEVHLAYAQSYLLPKGKFEEALEEVRFAARLDPLAPDVNGFLGRLLSLQGNQQAAIREFKKVLDLEPDFYLAHWGIGNALAAQGKLTEARQSFEKAAELAPGNPFGRGGLAYLHALQGEKDKALRLLQDPESSQYVSPLKIAQVHAVLGERDEAFRWLRKGIEERDPLVALLAVLPEMQRLRPDPRFKQLLRTMNLGS